jgi:hypothetical protein
VSSNTVVPARVRALASRTSGSARSASSSLACDALAASLVVAGGASDVVGSAELAAPAGGAAVSRATFSFMGSRYFRATASTCSGVTLWMRSA